jgi:hypothetical protein
MQSYGLLMQVVHIATTGDNKLLSRPASVLLSWIILVYKSGHLLLIISERTNANIIWMICCRKESKLSAEN